ncbi:bile acid-CoA:amino acid N-acyltransferase-like isoform X1 [Mastacembelus armatus]|nr:bile acid-CoA:amino acid N-acyltransferase-like isoform X1 [Mastacembelus armatus]XP_026163889.1 bile acid-CoA:amino acid N-acyltransferase-like isoform X1 [Mastacembelus armatus]
MSLPTILQLPEIRKFFTLHRKLESLHHSGTARCRSSYRPAPLLSASPVRALVDEQIIIKGDFLPSHCPVTVCSRLCSEDGDVWEAFAHYNTNADGTINLSRDHSVGGSYMGCEPMGLFWGLQPAPGAREGLRLRKINVTTPYKVHLSLLEGHVSSSVAQATELAAVTTERWYTAPGVRRTDIRHNGVVGTLFLPPGPGPFPALLDLWGIGGGLVEYRSALLASRGYATLSLAYSRHKDLPGPQKRINVGGSYFKSAFHLIQDHHQVCANRVGIISLSFGVFLALRLAIQAVVKPSCLICINGPVGGSIDISNSEGMDFDGDKTHWLYEDQNHVSFRNVSLPTNFFPGTILKMENLACPIMYIVGEDDLSTSSTENANLLEETLRAAGKSKLLTRLSYPGAGHLIEPPYSPSSRASLWSIKPKKLITLWGGHPAPHAAAQEDAWKKILDFMESNLRQ